MACPICGREPYTDRREKTARMAMAAILSTCDDPVYKPSLANVELVARAAVAFADGLLTELDKPAVMPEHPEGTPV